MITNNLLEFLLYILPGFIAREIFTKKYPIKRKSDFENITWSLFYGIIIFFSCKYIYKRGFLIDFFENLLGINLLCYKTILLLFAGIGFGYLLIFFISLKKMFYEYLNNKHNKKLNYRNFHSVWEKIIHVHKNSWVVVVLKDGSKFFGYISDYQYDPNNQYQDLFIKEAKKVELDDKNQYQIEYTIKGNGLYLRTDEISHIEYWDSN